ncbi:MAG: PilZ domain-containing protein [Phycisphaerales bacterium]|nr:PilZ domain-containing protein [Phycisphaerales bacterium]
MPETTTAIAHTAAAGQTGHVNDNRAGGERRQHARRAVTKPCKLFHCPSRRYLVAKTCDLSASGALIHLEDGRVLTPGEEVLLVVDWTGRNILPADRMVHGTVVRIAGSIGRHQSVGVRFAQASELAAVA